MASEQILEYDPSYLLYGGGATFVANIVIFRLIGPSLSSRITPKYKLLAKKTQAEWNDRIISNVNAAVSICLSCVSLLYEEGIKSDVVWWDSFLARLACGFIVGYMLADIVIMILWCQITRSELIGYAFHHAATVYAYFFISAYGVLCYFGMLRLVAEVSTPFVNQRWFFDILHIPRTKWYVILNGISMVVSFFFSRMVTMPIYWYQIWLVTGTDAAMKLGHIQLIMYAPCLVLDVLNVFWFMKMCRGLVKAIKGLKTSQNNDVNTRLETRKSV